MERIKCVEERLCESDKNPCCLRMRIVGKDNRIGKVATMCIFSPI
jgi:hypothetical protein